ncbi:MAG: hypothetical protein ACPG4N_09800, partial [Gammaproteobacteria bacterium]
MLVRWLWVLLLATTLSSGCALLAPEEPPPEEEPAPIEPTPPPPPENPPEVVPFVQPGNWKFEAGAVLVRVNPVEKLNYYRNRAHPMVLGVYQ